jgi:hypothetical protein
MTILDMPNCFATLTMFAFASAMNLGGNEHAYKPLAGLFCPIISAWQCTSNNFGLVVSQACLAAYIARLSDLGILIAKEDCRWRHRFVSDDFDAIFACSFQDVVKCILNHDRLSPQMVGRIPRLAENPHC